MERMHYRSTSPWGLLADLRQRELLDEAARRREHRQPIRRRAGTFLGLRIRRR